MNGHADDGLATIWAAAAAAALLALGILLCGVGSASSTRHRAVAAADLAALAAATHARSPDPCATARRVTDRMSARLLRCDLHGWDARIEVSVDANGLLSGFGSATARARAGPASGDPPPWNGR